jgi:hypothetical protein
MSASTTDLVVNDRRRVTDGTPLVSAGNVPSTTMALVQAAVATGNIDMIERMVALHERQQDRQAELEYNQAMSAAQEEMRSVSFDLDNSQTRSRYASYAAIDKAIRPIYTRHGFGISFDTADSNKPEHIKIICKITHRGGHCETKQVDMPADGKGAKGGDVMTKTHATGAAMAYGQRYLVKLAFNVATGEEDTDGNGTLPQWAQEYCDAIGSATDAEECFRIFKEGCNKASGDKKAQDAIIRAKDARKKVLQCK